MRSIARGPAIALALGWALVPGLTPAGAAPPGPAEKSLDRCQSTIRTESVKYVQATQKAIATCLGKVAGEIVKKNAGDVAAAVGTCATQLHKIGRTDGRSIADQFTAKVAARCAPAPANAHTLDDLLGSGAPGVAEPLGAGTSLGAWCAGFGGDGSVDSLGEWLACARAAQDCAARSAVAAAFPRAIEWLDALAAAMPASSARDAAVALEAALDGAVDDDLPGLQCGVACGPGVDAAACDLPDACPTALRERSPNQVIVDLHAAIAAEDWTAVACNYAPDAYRVDDQGVLVGASEITAAQESLHTIAGAAPQVTEMLPFGDVVRVLFTLDAGWFEIPDGTATYVVRRGKIRTETWHGLIEFNGPPPE